MSCSCCSLIQTFAPPNAVLLSLFKLTISQAGLPQTIIAMITSNMARAGHPSRVTLLLNSAEGKQAGILMDSVVMTDNLATIRDSEIDRKLGTINDMTDIDRALRNTLGL